MMISLTIGYQEKKAKQTTAPSRKPCPVRLVGELAPEGAPAGGRWVAGVGVGPA